MFEGRKFDAIYIAAGYTDLRAGLAGLASIIQNDFNIDPFANNLFLFCGRRADRFKALYWDGSGFVMTYKRVETGHFRWPRKEQAVLKITDQQMRWLFEGLSIYQGGVIRTLETEGMYVG